MLTTIKIKPDSPLFSKRVFNEFGAASNHAVFMRGNTRRFKGVAALPLFANETAEWFEMMGRAPDVLLSKKRPEPGTWLSEVVRLRFANEKDALMFKMRWL